MITIAMNAKEPINRSSLLSINQTRVQAPLTARTIHTLHMPPQADKRQTTGSPPMMRTRTQAAADHTSQPRPAPLPARQKLPPLTNPVQKGQKVPLQTGSGGLFSACFGWNTSDARCDADVSAFLLGADGKVIGDSWFVFYGQANSPDGSCRFAVSQETDREVITVDLQKLNPAVQKIVFVLTINEAFAQRLHFGMMQDAYIRILDRSGKECTSYQMTEYYSNVISMMIGEIYRYKGNWKFHAVGNGVARDLAGLCALYGVEVSD